MKITDAIKSIPEKREKLQKAFEALLSCSSSLASFDLQWEDIDNHFSAIEKSVQDRIKSLQGKEGSSVLTIIDAGAPCEAIRTASARPGLRSLCVKMDAKGLLAYISRNRIDLTAIRNELPSAIRCAPDSAQLVLDAMDLFYSPNFDTNFYPKSKTKATRKGGVVQTIRRTCIDLLETLHLISSEIEIKPSVRENARKLATQWRSKVHPVGDNYSLEVSAFLQLTASYDLVSYFNSEDVLDLLISVSKRKQTIELIKSLRLVDKLPGTLLTSRCGYPTHGAIQGPGIRVQFGFRPGRRGRIGYVERSEWQYVFIQKLNSKGRQLDAVKFVCAFDMTDKFPLIPFLKAYVAEAKKIAQEYLVKGSYSAQSQHEAIAKEIGALRSVIRFVIDYELESEYPLEQLESRTAELEEKKGDIKKQAAAAAAATPKSNPQQHQQLSNKRQRSSDDPVSFNPPPYHSPFVQNTQQPQPQPQLGAAEHTPYMGIVAAAGPYGYTHAAAAAAVGPSGLGHHGGGTRSPPRPIHYHVTMDDSHAVINTSTSTSTCTSGGGPYERSMELRGFPPAAYMIPPRTTH